MTRYIALLRGINVGGKKKVPMAQLRELMEGLGYTDVATLLQSGNAVFSSKEKSPAKVIRQLETAIAKEFGFEVAIILRTRDELAAAIQANPLPGAEDAPSQFLVMFLSDAPDAKRLQEIDPAAYLPDEFRVVGREIYARFPNTIRDSKLATVLGGTRLGVTPTGRNWSTVLKLLELADS
ncbi:DUF1697 domain-containing protein [Vitiosangium sp. GDMCC 1.1324]|uniref:DUF1697 domain-containing protein n=1 Tax=Vitiosangium sp. (strain GDMCC 1.1324) TaxID=2138576 RepID=UPI000D3579E5|nr:DUF1697 domain-containing protein [Vitiosangium sp. GDMCC 1.1324]PTL79604.1 hypothetical protein DAT35_32860 [Vitiosangium sp. GDMCC 1.1324]